LFGLRTEFFKLKNALYFNRSKGFLQVFFVKKTLFFIEDLQKSKMVINSPSKELNFSIQGML